MQECIWVLCEELDPTESFDETRAKNIWTFNDFKTGDGSMSCVENLRKFVI